MKAVLLYTSADDVATRAPAHFQAHRAWLDQFAGQGDLLLIGTFADPQQHGSMSIFRTRAEAERFAAGDPFVLEGVVRSYEILDWNEILTP